MTIDFYTTFAKRVNSTKRPTGNPARSLTGYLREPCSVINPRVKIERLAGDDCPEGLTYAYIPSFQRYYFVNDWTWAEGVWECSMTVDALASWKTQIGELSEYVQRVDSTTDFNGAITDGKYPATTNFSIEMTTPTTSNPFVESLSQGTYILGIINGDNVNSVGAVNYYAMTPTQFQAMKRVLFSDENLFKMGIIDASGSPLIEEMSKELVKTFYDPYQYIASCTWYPLQISDLPIGGIETLQLGWWNYNNLQAHRVTSQVKTVSESILLPEHPQVTRGKYLDYAPYTKRTLFGKFGSYPVDTSFMEVGSYINVFYYIDLITGMCKTQFWASETSGGRNRKQMGETDFLIGVPIQIAQIGRDYLGTAVNVVDALKSTGLGATIGGLIGGFGGTAVAPASGTAVGTLAGAVIGGVMEGARDIYNTLDSAMPQLRTSGTNGSFVTTQVSTILISQFFVIVDENITHRGRPLCKIRTIKNLSGYIECADGDIQFPCTLTEKNLIGSHLTGGFFWE